MSFGFFSLAVTTTHPSPALPTHPHMYAGPKLHSFRIIKKQLKSGIICLPDQSCNYEIITNDNSPMENNKLVKAQFIHNAWEIQHLKWSLMENTYSTQLCLMLYLPLDPTSIDLVLHFLYITHNGDLTYIQLLICIYIATCSYIASYYTYTHTHNAVAT